MPLVVEAEVLGGYPRSERVRKTLRRFEEKAEEGFIDVAQTVWEDTLLIVGAQLGAGLTIVVDPVIDWHDPLRPFAEAWRNVAVDGLLRWFDNNFFYRIPVFTDMPDPKKLVTPPRVIQLKKVLPKFARLKIVLPGPVTFARLSKNMTGRSLEELAAEIAAILAREAEKAAEAGAAVVQVDEPFLADIDATPDDAELAAELASRILGAASAKGAATRLAIPYNVPEPQVYEKLLSARANYIVLSMADNPAKALQLLQTKGLNGHGLGAGVVQARDIYPDSYEKAREVLNKAVEATGAEKLLVTTSAWLDLIPLNYAIEKTRIVAIIAERYRAE
ncbi:MAG TPA: methylcobalamin--homocysteine methyltransferase, partial [Pyrodictium delaneyi]|nr:methylcobalamin--homocysteine methyltransferase [Pyrodictium delaneyi]